jgi:hypothetical protein
MKGLTKLSLLLLFLSFSVGAMAEGPKGGDPKTRPALAKTMTQDVYDFISINSILMYISNNGCTAFDSKTSATGFEWPQGSGKHAIFEDGLIWGGTVQGGVRVGGSTYSYGMQAGPIMADGQPATGADPRYRIYKIRKVGSESFKKLTADEQARLKKDFVEWPIVDGAPWIDSDHDGQYSPNFEKWLEDSTKSDKPWFVGDEVLWFVCNDKDAQRTQNLYGSPPIGLETHTLLWGYQQTGPLGNMIFEKHTVINKGNDDLQNAYFSQWSDPDLGDANDDFVGVDTALVLGYDYNGLPTDGVYGIPPAVGYDFFQGPIVRSAGDVAHFKFGLRQGFRNLGVSSFAFYINGSTTYKDPTLHDPVGATEMYNYQMGLTWQGNRFIDPTTSLSTKITLAGDPVKRTGWIDGITSGPGDRRFLMTAGPFTLAVNDTQEIVVARIIGKGADRISSVQVLKYYDQFAQRAFDQNFDLFKPPPTPNVKVSALDKRIDLYWGDQKSAEACETFNDRGYKFQGYNIYQFPSKSSLLADAKRIATYDIIDNVLLIFDDVIDPVSGAIVSMPVQFGNDTGVKRFIDLTTDFINDIPLVNNQPYYYAVTAYSYNASPEAVPKQLESTPAVFEARPQTTNPGTRFGMAYNESPTMNHTLGYSTGKVIVKTIDPLALTGHTYEVAFDSVGTVDIDLPSGETKTFQDPAWNLRDLNTQGTLIYHSKDYGVEKAYTVDGFRISLDGVPYYDPTKEILAIDWKGGPAVYTSNTADYAFMTGEAWGWGSLIPGYLANKTVEIRFSQTKTSKGYLWLRNGTPSYGCTGYNECKLQVWDVSSTDPAQHRQLEFGFVENKDGPSQDGEWDPVEVADREYLVILDKDYSDTPDSAFMKLNFRNEAAQMPLLYVGWYSQTSGISNYGVKYPWREDDKWTITPNVPFTTADKFTFTTEAPTVADVVLAKQDVTQINVFPNPYVGANAQELNKYQRFVTFNHLPQVAHFRIYTVTGTLVRSFDKNDGTQLAYWDLLNDNGLPVASGMYIIHIQMPGLDDTEKVLKLGVVQEAQYLDRI